MIVKVQPVVEEVRLKGDAVLLDLTAKFGGVELRSPVLLPPCPPGLVVLGDDVRDAIDKAYSNIHKFHKAQATGDVLVVETMPGVVCSRFARPIVRV